MSKASERKRMTDTLAGYSLVGVKDAARFLDCSAPQVRRLLRDGVIPSVAVGCVTKIDPLDLAVHVLAGRDGISAEEYWRRHGEATPDLAWQYVARLRKLLNRLAERAA